MPSSTSPSVAQMAAPQPNDVHQERFRDFAQLASLYARLHYVLCYTQSSKSSQSSQKAHKKFALQRAWPFGSGCGSAMSVSKRDCSWQRVFRDPPPRASTGIHLVHFPHRRHIDMNLACLASRMIRACLHHGWGSGSSRWPLPGVSGGAGAGMLGTCRRMQTRCRRVHTRLHRGGDSKSP